MMEQWVLEKWSNVVLEEFSLPAKRKIRLHPLKTQPSNIPSFQYSISKANTMNSKKPITLKDL
jgi:hypothetical protein